MPRRPIGTKAMTAAERQARSRAKKAARAPAAETDIGLAAPRQVPSSPMPREQTLLVLAAIAADPSQPATARVAACRALLAAERAQRKPQDDHDAITARALQLAAKRNAESGRLN